MLCSVLHTASYPDRERFQSGATRLSDFVDSVEIVFISSSFFLDLVLLPWVSRQHT